MYVAKLYIPFDVYPEIKKVPIGNLMGVPLYLNAVDTETQISASLEISEVSNAFVFEDGIVVSFELYDLGMMKTPDFDDCKIVLDIVKSIDTEKLGLNKIMAISQK